MERAGDTTLLGARRLLVGGCTGFGEASAGDTMTFDSTGRMVTFRIRNLTRKPVTIVKRFSCSGLSDWWLEGGADGKAFGSNYAYEPVRNGLSQHLETRCTVNVPRSYLTIRPGKVASIEIPFAKADALNSGDLFLRAGARVNFKVSGKEVLLQSPAVRRN